MWTERLALTRRVDGVGAKPRGALLCATLPGGLGVGLGGQWWFGFWSGAEPSAVLPRDRSEAGWPCGGYVTTWGLAPRGNSAAWPTGQAVPAKLAEADLRRLAAPKPCGYLPAWPPLTASSRIRLCGLLQPPVRSEYHDVWQPPSGNLEPEGTLEGCDLP